MIKKIGNRYRVMSHTTGRNLGEYRTAKEAKTRLKQVSRFRKKESNK